MLDNFILASTLVEYDCDTGFFTWKPRPVELYDRLQSASRFNQNFAGKRAESKDVTNGYLRICVTLNGHRFMVRAHRLAWFIMNGCIPSCTDHINGDRSDNRIENLRSVSRFENGRNMGIAKNNKSGFVGVNYCNTRQKWVAKGFKDGKRKHLGYFESAKEAAAARRTFETSNGYHVNHGSRDSWVRKDNE